MAGYFVNSGVLFNQAVTAFKRSSAAKSPTQPSEHDALVAILFSAASLEAWIAEMPVLLSSSCFEGIPRFQTLADVLAEAEESRASVRFKYLLAKSILTGESYDKGAYPYQDFNLLFSLRDTIVHMKPERIPGDKLAEFTKLNEIPGEEATAKSRTQKLIQALASRGLCSAEKANVKSSWITKIEARKITQWCCKVVQDMVNSVCDGLRSHVKDPTIIDLAMMLSRFENI